ncbi:MAG: hypothetical protein J6U15_04185, partial [Lachnospiraceae bacterium]|nr:hypothetical protein [Lachnospiraceae bacterium]
MAKENVQLFFRKAGDALKKNGPQIAIVGGVLGLIGAGIWACVKTTKFEEKTEVHKEKFADLKQMKESGVVEDKEYRSEWLKEVCSMGWTCIKLYWGPALLAGVSATGIIFGKKTLVKRWNVSTQIAAGTKAMFDSYRERVAARIGQEAEREIYNGVKDVEYTEEKPGKDGTIQEVKKQGKELTEPDNLYSFKFNAKNFPGGFEKNISYNLTSLQNEMASWNTFGRARAIVDQMTGKTISPGKVTLYEILDDIGYEWHPEGLSEEELKEFEKKRDMYQVLGWRLTRKPDEAKI